MNAALVRQNTRAILEAATRRGKGRREWACAPGTHNAIKASTNTDAFDVRKPGNVELWWSEFRTTNAGTSETRCGMWRFARAAYIDNRSRMKAEARNLIFQLTR